MKTNTQHNELTAAEARLGLGPVAMAAEMGTPYSTYLKWRNESRTMPAVGWRCLELVLAQKDQA